MESRKRHEKEYHDQRFASNVREKAGRFYVIAASIRGRFDSRLDELCRNASALEIGCAGGGRMSRLAAAGNRVTAIDISESAIDRARRTADRQSLANIDLRLMDAEQLDFPDGSFDVVYGSGILHHLDLEIALGEIARVLKPRGTALFIEPLGHNPLINCFRRLTPAYRTVDEHPLLMRDIEYTRSVFADVSVRFYYLIGIAAIPFAKLPFFRSLLRLLEGCDRMLFAMAPFMRRYAWMALMEIRKKSTTTG